MTRPDFFIVGAPKCGTTALDTYLGEHPEIFLARKEPHYFGSDLDEVFNRPGATTARLSRDQYFGLFAGSEKATRRGEASVWYLWSRCAAKEIHDYNPQSQIIAMVRNPVDMLPSLHSQYVYNKLEDLQSFADALDAEGDRRAGRRIPPNNGPHPWRLFYREVARFHEQLERYFTIFGRDQVHVIVYDDLASDPGSTYRGVLDFLGVAPTFVPTFHVRNANKRIRSRWLQRAMWTLNDESSSIRRIGSRLIPVHGIRSTMLRRAIPALKQINTAVVARPGLPLELRARLAAELAPDVDRLSHLLDRDLSHWYAAPVVTGEQISDSVRRPSVLKST